MDIKVLLSTIKDKKTSEQHLVTKDEKLRCNGVGSSDSDSIFYPEISHTLLGLQVLNLGENWLKR